MIFCKGASISFNTVKTTTEVLDCFLDWRATPELACSHVSSVYIYVSRMDSQLYESERVFMFPLLEHLLQKTIGSGLKTLHYTAHLMFA
jgi:hypothetical protein